MTAGTPGAIARLTELWGDVRSRLAPDRDAELLALTRRYTDAVLPGDIDRTEQAIAHLLSRSLPREHPVRTALAGAVPRLNRPPTMDETRARVRLVEGLRAVLDPAGRPPTVDEVATAATARLLRAAAVTDEDVPDPVPHLIRLDRPDGTGQWPAFQFGPDGRPLATVLAVNRILEAEEDPWGVADWWLGAHTALPDTPANLLGRVDASVLIAAARAERWEG
ncbi:hypothetical protein [Actinokineospora sp. NBRC 105648]|uniref:hypothetical protein n=1 Tax=Actinokineospora sp. NBRC 105648 TaxID=3032206 RepID=UPI00249FD9CD|nr:hypothetical protein [Actinokineospora sp. NBRC 105648]GLZ42323.1 hypothetical protein Acsp05_59470 [Actinokineospora sp. NBRC 105648]